MATDPSVQTPDLTDMLDQMMHPYRDVFPVMAKLPAKGRDRDDILNEMKQLHGVEESRWKDGYASGSVYHGDTDHIDFVNEVYNIQSQSNQLHSDLWPSAAKFEAEIIAMVAKMLNAEATGAPFNTEDGICGAVSSGGSESILLAMKAYRDRARDQKNITEPEIVLPISAHAAFHKAAQYFNMKLRIVSIDDTFRANLDEVKAAINDNTVAVVGSASNFPYGTVDPIEDLSELARQAGVGCHVDSCLGGFFLPWAEKLGEPVPPFDFRLPGVTSMSCDTHKYGYAPKGTSVVLYRTMDLRRYQYFTTSDWPGGLYYSPTFSGSRPGGLSAACWASLVYHGEKGYLESTKKILDAVAVMRQGVEDIPELKIHGHPFGVFSFGSDQLNVYQVLDQMSARRWSLTGLLNPAGVHVSPTMRHTQPGVPDRFVEDLNESVEYVRDNPDVEGGFAPVYGLAASVPDRTVVHDMLKQLMDIYYRI
jgi:glutamate/tyrosine decarboxylase-like PLP-dependent enzyme